MVCTFFGKRDTPSGVRRVLMEEIGSLIDAGVKCFYVGNNGNFDLLVQSVLVEFRRVRSDFCFFVVLSRLDEPCQVKWDLTLFPEELALVPPRFAISERNRWMIKNSDVVITYATDRFSTSHKWREAARRRGLKIIDLANRDE